MLELDRPVLDAVPLTNQVKGVDLFRLLTFRQGFVGKLKPIVSEDVVDPVGVEGDDCVEESGAGLLILPFPQHHKSNLADSVNRGVDVAALAVDLGSVEKVDMEIADAVLSKLPDLPFGDGQLFRQTGQAVARQYPINLHRIEIGDVSLQGEEDIFNRLLELLPLKQYSLDLVCAKIGAQTVRSGRKIFRGIPLFPFPDRLSGKMMPGGQGSDRFPACLDSPSYGIIGFGVFVEFL